MQTICANYTCDNRKDCGLFIMNQPDIMKVKKAEVFNESKCKQFDECIGEKCVTCERRDGCYRYDS
jgi:hypothetical protein